MMIFLKNKKMKWVLACLLLLFSFPSLYAQLETDNIATKRIAVNHYRPSIVDLETQRLGFLVKDLNAEDATWELFKGDIKDFHFRWGYTYEIVVEEIQNQATSVINYRFVDLVRTMPVAAGTSFDFFVGEHGKVPLKALIQPLSHNRYQLPGSPVFEVQDSMISDQLLMFFDHEDRLSLRFTYTGDYDVPLVLTRIMVNGIPVPTLSHLGLLMFITLLAACGLVVNRRQKKLRRFRTA